MKKRTNIEILTSVVSRINECEDILLKDDTITLKKVSPTLKSCADDLLKISNKLTTKKGQTYILAKFVAKRAKK